MTFYKRGISENTISDLEERWQEDTLQLKPDVLSILVGINDVGAIVRDSSFRQSLDRFEQNYRELLKAVELQNPRIFLQHPVNYLLE